jgi:hypothetical protein
MDALSRAIVVAAIILGGALVVRGLYPADRYLLVAAQGGAFRVDRLTGSVLFCDLIVCRSLPIANFVPGPQKPAPQSAPPGAATGT